MNTYLHFTVRSNWGDWDRLGDTDLVDGEQIFVIWPNGNITAETVRLVKGHTNVSDYGHTYVVPDRRGFIDVQYYGLKIAVPLRGSELRAKRAL